MIIKVKKLFNDAMLPTKAHASDAGADLYAHSRTFDVHGNAVYGTGIAIEVPEGHVGLLFPRSSNSKKALRLTNCVGVLDSGYRGEVMFKFRSDIIRISLWQRIKRLFGFHTYADVCYLENQIYEVGDRIGQLIVMPYPQVEFVEAEELSTTERGAGGYGSSGK